MKHARLGMTTAACMMAALAALAPTASAGVRFGQRTLHMGSRGHDVKVLQSWLTHLGISTSIDGVFGPGTRGKLRRFEKANAGFTPDGRLARGEAQSLRKLIESKFGVPSPVSPPAGKAQLASDGRTAVAPANAPQAVKDVVNAANQITRKPYRYGGGHGSFEDSGYDCSGAVSYALHGAGLLRAPLDSSGFYSWGRSGRGSWITVYTRSSHAYVVIAGLRFDTSGSGESGPRWRTEARSSSGYAARHPSGL
jgi:cell wall-associated NlpC family hydrolase